MSKEPDLPGLLPALARSLRFAYGAEPVLLTACFGLIAASWIPPAFLAIWLKLLADGVVAHRDG
jgi:ATP-binding cassette subfamily B protein